MERFIPPNFQNFEAFIENNQLVYTDPRYSLGDNRHTFDVVQFTDDDPIEKYKRLLLIKSDVSAQADFFWNKLTQANRNYILPHRDDISTENIVAYEIPVSIRPLLSETKKYKNVAQNRMNNEKIAYSLGKMIRVFAESSGLYLEPITVELRSAIVDFIDDDTEPVIIVPPLLCVSADEDLLSYYSDMFDYDNTFKKPFLEALTDEKM